MCEECDEKDLEIESLKDELEREKERADLFYNALDDIDTITHKTL